MYLAQCVRCCMTAKVDVLHIFRGVILEERHLARVFNPVMLVCYDVISIYIAESRSSYLCLFWNWIGCHRRTCPYIPHPFRVFVFVCVAEKATPTHLSLLQQEKN